MKDGHIRKYFLDWLEKKLDKNDMEMIQSHLQSCDECRTYYDRMQIFLNNPEPLNLPKLQPDSFLPTRIRELAKQKENKTQFLDSLKSRFRLTFGVLMICFALMIGIFLGKWVSSHESISETEIMLSYSSMFTDEGIGRVWNNIVVESNGEN